MKNFNIVIFPVLLIAVFISCYREVNDEFQIPKRIISLSPSITETLFALGLDSTIIGVTSYCNYPPRAAKIERVGGYIDANLERIITLKPDLVILQNEHKNQRAFLNRFGIKTLLVGYNNCAEICSSFVTIGKATGTRHKSDSLVNLFRERLKIGISHSNKPGVLLCVGRDDPGSGNVRSIYVAGPSTYYNDLIGAAGATNVIKDSLPYFPNLSREGILNVSPDIIIDIASAMGNYKCSQLTADWESVDFPGAVKKSRVFCLSPDYTAIPGPRALQLLDDFREIIQEYIKYSKGNRS